MYIVYVVCNYDFQSMTDMQHNIQFLHCDCEPLPLTFGVSKAMASNSRYAFTFDLLDWAEAVLLECHVALKVHNM